MQSSSPSNLHLIRSWTKPTRYSRPTSRGRPSDEHRSEKCSLTHALVDSHLPTRLGSWIATHSVILRRQNRKVYLIRQETNKLRSSADARSCSCNMPDNMDPTPKGLTSLPDELLLEVVGLLDSKSLKNLRSTCGRFERFVNLANIKKLERHEKLSQLMDQIYMINCIMGTGKSLKDIEERIEQSMEPVKARHERLHAIRKDEEQRQEGVEEFTAYLENRRIAEATFLLHVWILRLVMHNDPADQARLERTLDGSLRRRISDIKRSIREVVGRAKRRWRCYMRRLGVRRSG